MRLGSILELSKIINKNHKMITHFSISVSELKDADVMKLTEQLKRCHNLTHLEMKGAFGEWGFYSIIHDLLRNKNIGPNITDLTLFGKKIKDSIAMFLARTLNKCPIKSLKLCFCGVEEKGAEALSNYLNDHHDTIKKQFIDISIEIRTEFKLKYMPLLKWMESKRIEKKYPNLFKPKKQLRRQLSNYL